MARFLTPKLHRVPGSGGGGGGGTGVAPDEYNAYDGVGGTTVNATATTIPLAQESFGGSDPAFTLSGGTVEINKSGRVILIANVGLGTRGTTGWNAEVWLEVNTGGGFQLIPGTYSYMGAGTV